MTLHRRLLVIVSLLVATTVGMALWWTNSQLPPNTLQVDHHRFKIIVAKNQAEQTRGLGGTTKLEDDHGMLFLLEGKPTSFWMKDMLINIDIVWIRNNTIVGINHNVPAPKAGTSDAELLSYPSPVSDPQAVLEVAAGQVKARSIRVGDKVRWNTAE